MRNKEKIFDILFNVLEFAAIGLICFSCIKFGINSSLSKYYVDGASMNPTFRGNLNLENGSSFGYLDKTQYALDRIERFDIVDTYYSFLNTDYQQPFIKGESKPLENASLKIKRIIGIPGDTIVIDNDYFSISYVENNEVKKFEFTSENCPFERNGDKNNGDCIERRNASITLEEDQYFVMGDNWTKFASLDCCNTSIGDNLPKPIYKECIVGVAVNILGTCKIETNEICNKCKHKNDSGAHICVNCGSTNLETVSEMTQKEYYKKPESLKGLWQKYIGSLDI